VPGKYESLWKKVELCDIPSGLLVSYTSSHRRNAFINSYLKVLLFNICPKIRRPPGVFVRSGICKVWQTALRNKIQNMNSVMSKNKYSFRIKMTSQK
jgi:hypothetical protein